jgi:hypothetical protein
MQISALNPRLLPSLLIIAVSAGLLVPSALAAGRKKNPTSKIYVADVDGEAQIDTGETIDSLTKKSVYTAQGTVIQTNQNATNSMVFSNGTGISFAPETRLEVRKFVQEPFTPNRRDMEVEPSISNTQSFLPRGAVGICTSKMVAGSSMNYSTPNANINIRGRKVVINSSAEGTVVSSLEGEVTVQAGKKDAGGQSITAGQQAFIPASGGPIQIRPIDPVDMPALDDQVTMACMARKTVYFEVSDKETGLEGSSDEITSFDEADDEAGEIIATPTAPADIPVQLTVSAANLPARR